MTTDEEYCSNCYQHFNEDDRVSEIYMDTSSSHVKVEKALSTIFKLNMLNEFKPFVTDPSHNFEDEETNTVLCTRCGVVLSNLYKFYNEFQQLSHLQSNLSKKIGQFQWMLTKIQSLLTSGPPSVTKNNGEIVTGPNAGPSLTSAVNLSPWVKLSRLTTDQIMAAGVSDVGNGHSTRNKCSRTPIKNYEEELESDEDEMNFALDSVYEEEEDDEDDPLKIPKSEYNDDFPSQLVPTIDMKPQLYTCQKCSKQFVHPQNLEAHQKICHVNRTKVAKLGKSTKRSSFDQKNKIPFKELCLKSRRKRNRRKKSSSSTLPTFNCTLCDQTFSKCSDITEHLLTHVTHVEDSRGQCPLCTQQFEPLELMNHLRDHSRGMRACLTCGKTFGTRYKLLRHMQSHLSDDDVNVPFKCTQCDRGFYFPSLLREHVRSSHRNDSLVIPCKHCPEKLATPLLFRQHYTKEHAGEFPYSCKNSNSPNFCDRGFYYEKEWRTHLTTHLDNQEPSSRCTICGKIIKSSLFDPSKLALHMETCRGRKCHPCPICQVLCTKKYLRKHIKTHEPGRHFKCSICQKVLSSSASLKTHMKVHSGEKDYVCKLCGTSFAQAGNLRGHLRNVHFNEKSFLCTLCGKAFAKSYGLKRHMFRHSEERSYKCETEGCGKDFKDIEALKKHQKVHSEGLCLCSFCGKPYSQNSIKRHILTHTGERLKTCPHEDCESLTFIDNRQLKRHQKNSVEADN